MIPRNFPAEKRHYLDFQERLQVGGGDPADFLGGGVLQCCELCGDQGNVPRFVALAALGNWSEEWRIGLGEQHFARELRGDWARWFAPSASTRS